MNVRTGIITQFHEGGAPLADIVMWLGKVPEDKDDDYPRAVLTILSTSGRLVETFDETSYENCDIRIEIFAVGDTQMEAYQAAINGQFDGQRFNIGSGHLGMCKRTGGYIRYAGRATGQREIYCVSASYRLTIQNN